MEGQMTKIIPFGNRILVKREKAGSKLGSVLVAPDSVSEVLTEIAIVKHVPDHTFIDMVLIKESESMVSALTVKVKNGDSEAMLSLLRFNDYLRIKSIQVGDKVMISKYSGITFNDNFNEGDLSLCDAEDVIGIIK